MVCDTDPGAPETNPSRPSRRWRRWRRMLVATRHRRRWAEPKLPASCSSQSRASPRRRLGGRRDRGSGTPACRRRRVRAAALSATDRRPRFCLATCLSAQIVLASLLATSASRPVVDLLVLTADDIEDLQNCGCRILASALLWQLYRAQSQAPCLARDPLLRAHVCRRGWRPRRDVRATRATQVCAANGVASKECCKCATGAVVATA
jgi:hypothetical protein